jgi:hypothetical protein
MPGPSEGPIHVGAVRLNGKTIHHLIKQNRLVYKFHEDFLLASAAYESSLRGLFPFVP